jgi:hypothetical protein
MRPSDSAISLGGRSCEVENHVVFCWLLTISLSSNRQLYAYPFDMDLDQSENATVVC